MKKTILLAAAAGCLLQAQAQVTKMQLVEQKLSVHATWLNGFLLRQPGPTGRKPTGIAYRVIAQTTAEPGNAPDSTAFSYSGTRGSRYNYNGWSLAYGEVFESVYAPLPVVPYGPDVQELQFAESPTDMQADSIRYFSGDFTPSRVASYRPDNKINQTTTYIDPQATRQINNYDGQGHLVRTYTLESTNNGATFDTSMKRVYTYNGAFTRVATDTLYRKEGGAYQLSNTIRYYYNATDKLDSLAIYGSPISPSLLTQTTAFRYYPDGKLMKVTAIDQTLPDITISTLDSFGYTSGVSYTTLHTAMTYITMAGETDVNGSMRVRFPGAGGLPDSIKTYRYDNISQAWQKDNKMRYKYTSFGEPDSLLFFSNDDELLARRKFYYESYENTVSIKPVATHKDYSVYPNPFNNDLTIDWKEPQPEQAVLCLLDITGREVWRTNLKLNTGRNNLDLPRLLNGNYILQIRDSAGNAWSSKLVKR